MVQIGLRDASRVFWGLLAFEFLLLLSHIVVTVVEARTGCSILGSNYVDMDGEINLPAWFSGSQLLLIGMVAILIARIPNLETPPTQTFFWYVAMLFVYLSIDEITGLHERMTYMTSGIEWVPHFRGHRGVWIFVYLPFGLLLVILAHRHLWSLWRRHRPEGLLLIGGVLTYVAATAGLDAVAIHQFPDRVPILSYGLLVGAEEFLEMCGASLILVASLRLLVKMSQPGTSQAETVSADS